MADEAAQPDGSVQVWLNHIAAYDREFKPWQGKVSKILKKYRDDDRATSGSDSGARFNILWANVQTLLPATFSRLPKPDVSRRFRDNDPVGRVASLIVERALTFEVEHHSDFRHALEESIQDRFLGGRGTAWVRYEPVIGNASPDQEAGEADAETLEGERVPVDYVHWKDFGHTVARTWEEVTGVWRVVYMTRAAMVDKFGDELGSKIPLDSKPEDLDGSQMKGEEEFSRGKVYEIWDMQSRKVLFLSKSLNKIVLEKPDPLHLEEFWPCPRPLYASLTTDSLVPVPDFKQYQDQQATLDVLAQRIKKLVESLKVMGGYDASIPELARIFTEGMDSDLIPVKDWAAFAEKNGLQGAISLVDLAPIAAALAEAYKAMDNVKGQVYELTGIADIIRGQGEELETATAQALKGQYASLRLKSYQDEVAYFATELLRIKAQIMCGKFDDQTLLEMAAVDQLTPEDQEVVPQALQLLRTRLLRNFRVDIEADTLVQLDEQAEKEARSEFLKAVGGFIQQAMPMVEAAAEQGAAPLVNLIFTLLKFGVTGYRVGRDIEGQFDQALDQLKALLSQPRPAKPDPATQKAQIEQATQHARMQADVGIEQAKMQFEQEKFRMGQLAEQQAAERDASLEQLKQHILAAEQARQLAFEQWKAELAANTEKYKADLAAKTQLEVAEITQQTALDKVQVEAANAAETDTNAALSDGGQDAQAAASKTKKRNAPIDKLADMHRQAMDAHGQTLEAIKGMAEGHKALVEQLGRPKTVTMPDGRVARVQ